MIRMSTALSNPPKPGSSFRTDLQGGGVFESEQEARDGGAALDKPFAARFYTLAILVCVMVLALGRGYLGLEQ